IQCLREGICSPFLPPCRFPLWLETVIVPALPMPLSPLPQLVWRPKHSCNVLNGPTRTCPFEPHSGSKCVSSAPDRETRYQLYAGIPENRAALDMCPLELKRRLLSEWADHVERLVPRQGAALLR